MEVGQLETALKAVDSCLSHIKWRLRPPARRRLETDILALCTGLRPVVMVDYGGKMPELQEHLCMLINLAHKESSIFLPLRVMVIEDMIYMIHVRELAEHSLSNPSSMPQLLFVDLEQDPPKMLMPTDHNIVASELVSIQKFFSSIFPVPNTESSEGKPYDLSCAGEHITIQPSGSIDLSSCIKDTHVTIPTVNGWLLGYPVVYLFSKEHIADAVYNLSMKSLRLYKISICRNRTSGSNNFEEELMSFSVPYDLSMGGRQEPWAESFLAHMKAKFEKCKHLWKDLKMEVTECYPQAVIL